MKKLSNPKTTVIILIIFSFMLYLFIFKNLFSLALLLITSFLVVYFNGYCRYLFYNNHKENVKFAIRNLYNVIPIYDVKFMKKSKTQKTDYIVIFSISSIILFLLLCSIFQFNNLLLRYKIISTASHKSVKYSIYFSFILLLIFIFEDLLRIINLIFNYKVLFVDLINFRIEPIVENNDFKFHHRSIFLMEYDYKDYSIKDLRREKIYLEGKFERAKKPAFYDVYILPLIIIFVSGMLSIISAYINTFMFNIGTADNLKDALISYVFFAFTILIVVFIISFVIRKVSYNNIEDLKSRILVIENIISSREKKYKKTFPNKLDI